MSPPTLGVVVVAFNAEDVILDCLESLLASQGTALRIIVVDNASTDDTVSTIHDWAAGDAIYAAASDLPFAVQPYPKPVLLTGGVTSVDGPCHTVRLIATGINAGFAAGVNRGLQELAGCADVDRFWILNPDSVVAPETAAAFATQPVTPAGFALMGGRVLYLETPDKIQIDGGTINEKTGVTGNIGLAASASATPCPMPSDIHFITGASMVASRRFYEIAGPMPEDYFLYYEEVDWALRRGNLPLVYCAGGIVYHRAGTAIGSPTLGRPASPFSLYFKHRGRLRFMRRHFPRNLPYAYAYSLAKALQLLLKGYPEEARTILGASFDWKPSASIRARLGPEAARLAFGEDAA